MLGCVGSCRRESMPRPAGGSRGRRSASPRVEARLVHSLVLSEAKSRVSKDAPEGGARTGAYWSVLRGHFAAPQDEDVGMKCAELQNRDTRSLWIWNRAGLARARR